MPEDKTWALELRAALDRLGGDYARLRKIAETGIDQDGDLQDGVEARAAATAAATQALIHMTLALDQLPELKGTFTGGPIPDLIAALDDLRRGLKPDFFQPWPERKGQLASRLEMLKLRAVTSVLMIERSGATNAEAREIVAKIFADAGHRGKKRSPVSASSLFQWYTDLATGVVDTPAQQILADTMSTMPASITRAEAVHLVKIEAAKRL